MLKNIIKISTIPCSELVGMRIVGQGKAKLPLGVEFTELQGLKQPSKLLLSDKIEDRRRIYTAKLTILYCGTWLMGLEHKAFICEDVDGNKYLLGAVGKPFPMLSQSQTHPDKYTDSQLTEVNVSYMVPFQIPQIVE